MTKASTLSPEARIKETLHPWLRQRHGEDALIVDELGTGAGQGRIDVAAIDTAVHAYEIKSAQDSLARLERQVKLDSKVAETATLVTAVEHAEKAAKMVPTWWGLVIAGTDENTGEVCLSTAKEPEPNTGRSPYTVAQYLWRQEALEELKALGCAAGLNKAARHYLWLRLAQVATLEEVAATSARRMRSRADWPRNRESKIITN